MKRYLKVLPPAFLGIAVVSSVLYLRKQRTKPLYPDWLKPYQHLLPTSYSVEDGFFVADHRTRRQVLKRLDCSAGKIYEQKIFKYNRQKLVAIKDFVSTDDYNFEYGKKGNLVAYTKNHERVSLQYDKLKRITKIESPYLSKKIEYDATGQITRIFDFAGIWQYDWKNLKITMPIPGRYPIQYTTEKVQLMYQNDMPTPLQIFADNFNPVGYEQNSKENCQRFHSLFLCRDKMSFSYLSGSVDVTNLIAYIKIRDPDSSYVTKLKLSEKHNDDSDFFEETAVNDRWVPTRESHATNKLEYRSILDSTGINLIQRLSNQSKYGKTFLNYRNQMPDDPDSKALIAKHCGAVSNIDL